MHRAILPRFGVGLTLIAAAACSSDDGGTGPTPAISISASPTSATVVQGGSTQTTATLTRSGGFTGTVTFAVAGAPAGVTGTVGNTQTTGSTTTAPITIQVGSTVAPGPYTITVRATGTGVSPADVTFQLTVTEAPGITLSVAPAGAVSLPQGSQDGSKTVNIARVNYTGAVTLTAEGLPNGVTAAFAGSPVSGTSSVMTLTAAPGAAVGGPVTVTIRGTGPSTPANLSATTTFQLTITATPTFTLAITPPPATISVPVGTQNSSKTVTITRINYPAAISLTVEELPNGVTATFAGNPVTGNSSVLTVTAAPTAAVTGPITVTIRGTGAAFSARDEALPIVVAFTTVALTVEPPVFTQVAPGERHTCALATNNSIYCWGRNAFGQLGNGQIVASGSLTPVKVIGGLSFKAVHTGGNHTCGITQQDRGFCWGAGLEGQLGLGPSGTGVNSSQPLEIAGGQYRWQTMGHLGDASCGITTLPGLFTYCWGLNGNGELGDGTRLNAPSPVLVSGGHTFSSLGRYGGNEVRHKCAISIGFSLFCWGENDFGQIGNGTMGSDVLQPVMVGGTADTYFLTAQADDATCAIRTTGIAQCWGNNATGRIGDNSTISQSVPTTVSTTESFLVIGVGAEHVCALNLEKRAFCWGSNQAGQLGDGTFTTRLVPVPVTGGHVFNDIRVGNYQTCGVRTDGQILCWGYNQDGQLGDGTTTNRNAPTLIAALPP